MRGLQLALCALGTEAESRKAKRSAAAKRAAATRRERKRIYVANQTAKLRAKQQARDRVEETQCEEEWLRKGKELLELLAQLRRAEDRRRALAAARAPMTQVSSALQTLGLDPHQLHSESVIKRAFKIKARVTHPDRGGNAEAFAALADAREQALRAIGARR